MTAKNYYEEMRKAGLTEDITSNDEPDYTQPFYQSIFKLMEGFAQKRKITPDAEFYDVAMPLIEYLRENHHPHVTVIVTPTHAELLEGIKCFKTLTLPG
jgi:hypothetical protein